MRSIPPTSLWLAAAAAAGLAAGAPTVATAQPQEATSSPLRSGLWNDVICPGQGGAGPLLARARAVLRVKTVSPRALRQAQAWVRRALARSPRAPEGWFLLGRIAARLGQFQQAAAAYTKAQRLDPSYRPRQTALEHAMSLWHLGRWVAAGRILARLPRSSDPATVRSRLLTNAASAFGAAGRLRDAMRLLQRAIRFAPGYAPARWSLAVVYHRLGLLQRARHIARIALALDSKASALLGSTALYPTPADRTYHWALLAEARRDAPAAARLWRAYLKAAPRSPWRVVVRRALSRLHKDLEPAGHRRHPSRPRGATTP